MIMKTKVNKQWYNQSVTGLKNAKASEMFQVRRQFNRYKDAINGNKQPFDIENGISTDRLFTYLEEAVYNVGKSDPKLRTFLKNYEPDETIKVDWKGVKAEIKKFCAENNGILCQDDDEYLEFIGDLFCEPQFAIPDTAKNNDRVYSMMEKYFVDLYD